MKRHVTKGNVFEELGFDKIEAENLKVRAELMRALDTYIVKHKLTQAQAAKLFGASQPRISDLACGKISKFTIDMLINMLAKANIHVSIHLDRKQAA